jgi:hypothetical protein
MFLVLAFVAFGTSLLWTGLSVIDGRTVAFAAIALGVRTAVLYPILARLALDGRSRRLIAWLGPRGLSSLLLVLLPAFAAIPGGVQLVTITCFVVLLSVLVHGSGIAVWLRVDARRAARVGRSDADDGRAIAAVPGANTPITIEEVRARLDAGGPMRLIDSRSDRTWQEDDRMARGALRVPPNDAVRTAKALGLDRRGMLVVYCA